MRSIPSAMRTKLLNRIKSLDTDSEPSIRVVATQTATNILLTEPIHEDELENFGDVALRQMQGELEIGLAYAICLDDDIATIYRRNFPATMDYKWEKIWEFNEAEDVAIEFDGSWIKTSGKEWYYLMTEQFPYIFTVEDGDLYVQKWRDETTRLLLAEDVSQISACKGWQSSINPDDDQGLIIGYIKQGEVYYRTFAYSSLVGGKTWENERKVDTLGNLNTTLSVIRTNDFRIGFICEQSGQIKMAITKRTYPGASVKPEYINVTTGYSSFIHVPVKKKYGYLKEYVSIATNNYFLYDEGDHRLQVLSSERLYTTTNNSRYCSGVAVYLNKPLLDDLPSSFVSGCGVSSEKLSITNVTYDSENNALIYSFTWNEGYTPNEHPTSFNVTFPTSVDLTYEPLEGQIWYVEGKTVTLEQITINKYGYQKEYVSAAINTATFQHIKINHIRCFAPDETINVTASLSSFSYVPVGDIPV